MNDQYQRKKLPRHPRVWWSRIKARWPVLIWLGAVALVFYLYSVGTEFDAFSGVVQTVEQQVAPLETARLDSLFVTMGQNVTNGQVLAQMDTSLIDAEISITEALAAETFDNAAESLLQLSSRYQAQVAAMENSLNSERRALAEASGELEAVNSELAKLQLRVKESMILDNPAMSGLVARQAALKETVRTFPQSIAGLEESLRRARAEAASIKEWVQVGDDKSAAQTILERLQTRRGTAQAQLDELRIRAKTYTLKASFDGIAADLLQRPGNIVGGGSTVLTVLEANPRVVGYFPEIFAKGLRPGMKAEVRTLDDPPVVINATLDSLSPKIDPLPARVGFSTTQRTRGRRVVFLLEQRNGLISGETVNITIESFGNPLVRQWQKITGTVRGWFHRTPAAEPAAVSAPATEQTPVEKAVPAPEQVPDGMTTPAAERPPVDTAAPAADQAFVGRATTAEEPTHSDDAGGTPPRSNEPSP